MKNSLSGSSHIGPFRWYVATASGWHRQPGCVPDFPALQSATIHAARLIGRNDAGRLVRGGLADAVVVDADPLADASALEKVRVVVAQGAVVRNDL
jgi:cytosine/adenosine deaminase-related metal-dependent hydrolase